MENAEPEEPQKKRPHLNHVETARNPTFPINNKSGMGKKMCPDLSRDILWDILFRLPFKSLVRFKCVSKTWDSAINDPWFVKSHHQKQSTKANNKIVIRKGRRLFLADIESLDVEEFIDFPSELQLQGSCNGLICLTDRSESEIILWNLLTEDPNHIKPVSLQQDRLRYSYQGSVYGFGYDSSNDDYKVVRFSTFFYISRGITPNAWVYSLRKNAWKEIEIPPTFDFIRARNGVFTCGALHWLGESFLENQKFIFAVDLETDIFRKVPLPDSLVGLKTSLNIGVLGGCLSVTSLLPQHGVWVMKHYMLKESWTNLFSILAYKIARPISYSRDAKKVLLQEEGNMPYWYELEKQKFSKLGICSLGWGYCVVENYLETLVSATGYGRNYSDL
ncbi:hypothetical protein SLE2022_313250 [Rubroshorea leprosula]